MTLTDVMVFQTMNPKKRIVRKGNDRGMVSVWFTVKNGILMCSTLEMDNMGHYVNTRRAAFQESEHTDWILID